MKFLIVESESPEEREARRSDLGASSGESFASTLAELASCEATLVRPAEGDVPIFAGDVPGFDAVFLSGSPIHVYDDSPEVGRLVEFMRKVFASGTPSFGSCAGLHIATAAAGGSVRPMKEPMEAGIARRITATEHGAEHLFSEGEPPFGTRPRSMATRSRPCRRTPAFSRATP